MKARPSLLVIYVLSATVAVIIFMAIACATLRYTGSAPVFLFFTLSFFSMLGLMAPKPRSYGYGFFAAFFFLGFWPKAAMHAIWGASFLEAVGDFSGMPDQWDNALITAACGALGIGVARLLHIIIAHRRKHNPVAQIEPSAPQWYVNHRRKVWILSLAAMVILNVANYYYAFYKIGVNSLLILPLHLNVAAAWLINIGFAMWIVTLVFWDISKNSSNSPISLAMPLLEAFISSTSAMSRGIFAFHAVPYFIALSMNLGHLENTQKYRALLRMALWLIALLLISVIIVFWLRMPSMHGEDVYDQPRAEIVQSFRSDLAVQMPALLLKRWVGLEGLLAVEAAEYRSPDLFMMALTESPKNGIHSIFQRIAKVDFNRSDPTKTYLSNAGPVALLYMSNSRLLVFAGMFAISLILIVGSLVTQRWTGNSLLVAVAGAGLANVMAQTTFAYLTLVFLIEFCFTVALLGALQRAISSSGLRNNSLRVSATK